MRRSKVVLKVNQKRIARRVSQSQPRQALLGGHRAVWCPTHPGARWRRGLDPDLPRAIRSPPNSGEFCDYSKKNQKFYLRRLEVKDFANLPVAGGLFTDLPRPQFETLEKWKISRGLVVTLWRAAARGFNPFATTRPWGGTMAMGATFLGR